MEQINIQPIVQEIKKTIERHEIAGRPGEYRRWLWMDPAGKRKLEKNEYGCADAMNMLYTINDFYCDEATRKARIEAIQSMQNPETGLFEEATHHTYHTTAHCTAALQLFDAKPLYPLKALHKYLESKDELYALLDGLDWKTRPWSQSHRGAGVYAALVNADEITPEFSDDYFAWFRENTDPKTGFWKKGYAENAPLSNQMTVGEQASLFQYMAGGFHYLFNHEYAKQPLMYPEKVIDTCIDLYVNGAIEGGLRGFEHSIGFIQIDWVYCVTRALRQTGHRREEAMRLVEAFAVRYINNLLHLDYETNEGFNDLHALFGTVCCLAELQQALPGKLLTKKPMKLVLDRRPFI